MPNSQFQLYGDWLQICQLRTKGPAGHQVIHSNPVNKAMVGTAESQPVRQAVQEKSNLDTRRDASVPEDEGFFLLYTCFLPLLNLFGSTLWIFCHFLTFGKFQLSINDWLFYVDTLCPLAPRMDFNFFFLFQTFLFKPILCVRWFEVVLLHVTKSPFYCPIHRLGEILSGEALVWHTHTTVFFVTFGL
jgi:hypothetical protein